MKPEVKENAVGEQLEKAPGNSDQNQQDGGSEEDNEFNILQPQAAFELTEKENKIREHKYKTGNLRVQYTKIHCTACNVHLGSALMHFNKIFVHPLLKVLICQECYNFYKSGDFQQEEDGSETFCRWCGQGGKVVCCNDCPMVFCVLCIRLNFSYAKFAEIKNNDHWRCFSCCAKQLLDLKIHCFEFREYALAQTSTANSKKDSAKTDNEFDNLLKKLDYTICCSNKSEKRKIFLSNDNAHGKILNVKLIPQDETLQPVKFMKLNDAPNQTVSSSIKQPTRYDCMDKFQQPLLIDNSKVTFVGLPISAGPITLRQPMLTPEQSNPPTLSTIYIPTTHITNGPTPQRTPHFFFKPIQPKLLTTAMLSNRRNDQTHFAAKDRHIEKSVCSTALVNSTFASAMLNLTQMEVALRLPSDNVPLYNAMQESLSTAIVSLMQIQKELNNATDSTTNTITDPKENFYY